MLTSVVVGSRGIRTSEWANGHRGCRRIAAVVLAVFFFAACFEEPEQTTRLGSNAPIAIAIDRAADFLSDRSLEYDELWFVNQASARLGEPFTRWAPALRPLGSPQWAERVLSNLRNIELHRPDPLPYPSDIEPTPRAPLTHEFKRTVRLIGRMLLSASSCSAADPESLEPLVRQVTRDSWGYLLCHQAWALVVGITRGCLGPAESEMLREAMARRILGELLASEEVTDLGIEQMATLCLLGLCEWIPDAYVRRLVELQEPSGSWGDLPGEGVPENSLREEHTVALAFYTLANLWDVEPQPRLPSAFP
ncbi:MAG: hypothetical protein JRG90_12795 [Deltaproteobacteria bacterium]|nr:hypothetical protein [Deltaproteobacteria bacterium]